VALPVAPAASRATTVTVVVPALVAAPEMTPVGLMDSPSGSPVAVYVTPVPVAANAQSTVRPTGLLMPCGLARVSVWLPAAESAAAALPAAESAATALPPIVVATVRLPASGRLREESPMRIWYVPAVVLHALAVVSQCARSCALTVKWTVWDWPGDSVTRWKLRSWCTGSPVAAGSPT
jgi:hypothetical protein